MSHQDGLVNFGLSEPRSFVRGKKDFDGDAFPPPFGDPDLAVPSFADGIDHVDLFGDGSLDEKGKPRTGTRALFEKLREGAAVERGQVSPVRIVTGGSHVFSMARIFSFLETKVDESDEYDK